MLYLLDANVLITANNTYYPIDSVPEYWEWLMHHAENGRVKIPLEVIEEIQAGNDRDLLCAWMKNGASTVLKLDEQAQATFVRRVVCVGYAPDLNDEELEKLGRDPFLISYALHDTERRTIVTTEVSKPSKRRQNRHIPDVCQAVGARFCDPFALYRSLGFRTSWRR